ncbi:hypothetical protein V6O07_21470 [Arthrospira platensis SPKY2]
MINKDALKLSEVISQTIAKKSYDALLKQFLNRGTKISRIGGKYKAEEAGIAERYNNRRHQYQIYLEADRQSSVKLQKEKYQATFTSIIEKVDLLAQKSIEKLTNVTDLNTSNPKLTVNLLGTQNSEDFIMFPLSQMYGRDVMYQMITGHEVRRGDDDSYYISEREKRIDKRSPKEVAARRFAGLIWLFTIIFIFERLNKGINSPEQRICSTTISNSSLNENLEQTADFLVGCVLSVAESEMKIYSSSQVLWNLDLKVKSSQENFLDTMASFRERMRTNSSSVIRSPIEKLKNSDEVIIVPHSNDTEGDLESVSTGNTEGDRESVSTGNTEGDRESVVNPNIMMQPLRYLNKGMQGINSINNLAAQVADRKINVDRSLNDFKESAYNLLIKMFKSVLTFTITSISLIVLGFIGAILTGHFFILSSISYPISVFITVGLFQFLVMNGKE